MARDQGANSISRRSFCGTLAGVIVAPGIALAQDSKVRRIGILGAGAPQTVEQIQVDRETLREFGWVEGQNLHVERRYANNQPEALKLLAEELVRAKVEVIWTSGTTATLAAKRATTTIPIVFSSAGDPVLSGLVASLARPGGNVTGFSLVTTDVDAKRLTVLKELLPAVRRMGVLAPSANPYFRAARDQFERISRSHGLEVEFAEIGAAGEADGAIAQLAQRGAQALFVRGDPIVYDNRFEITRAALHHRLPTLVEQVELVREAGAMVSYGATAAEQDRRSASQVDRILRGARPADLPVEQPTKFELVINLKTARALGLAIPKELLLRADEVIQ